MESKQVVCNQSQLAEDNVFIVVDVKNYSSEQDNRYLIPFLKNNKYGLINHNYEVVVPAIYDRMDNFCYHKNDLIKVAVIDAYAYERKNKAPQTYTSYKYGVINTMGETVIPLEYGHIKMGTESIELRESYGYNHSGKHALVDKNGNIIVPFGKYDSFDPDVCGLVRCRKFVNIEGKQETLHGIVDLNGNEILECNHRYISPFYGEYEDKNFKYIKARIQLENPTDYNYLFGNPAIHKIDHISDRNKSSSSSRYGEFAGTYAQDVAGYSDDVINDAFDGDPDAYWNID